MWPKSPIPGAVASVFTDGLASVRPPFSAGWGFHVCTLEPRVTLYEDCGRLPFNPTPPTTTEQLVLPTMRASLLPSSGLSNGSSCSRYLAKWAPGDTISTRTQTTPKSAFFTPERLLTVIDSLFNWHASSLIKSEPSPQLQLSGPRCTCGASQHCLLATRRRMPWR